VALSDAEKSSYQQVEVVAVWVLLSAASWAHAVREEDALDASALDEALVSLLEEESELEEDSELEAVELDSDEPAASLDSLLEDASALEVAELVAVLDAAELASLESAALESAELVASLEVVLEVALLAMEDAAVLSSELPSSPPPQADRTRASVMAASSSLDACCV